MHFICTYLKIWASPPAVTHVVRFPSAGVTLFRLMGSRDKHKDAKLFLFFCFYLFLFLFFHYFLANPAFSFGSFAAKTTAQTGFGFGTAATTTTAASGFGSKSRMPWFFCLFLNFFLSRPNVISEESDVAPANCLDFFFSAGGVSENRKCSDCYRYDTPCRSQ